METWDTEWFRKLPDKEWLLPEEVTEKEGKEIADLFFTHEGMKVFDCPCGDGRISIHLARKGASVTGIDINPRFIESAKRRFAKEGFDTDFSVCDMRDASFPGGCDLFLSWFNSFGYFSDEENKKFMHTISDCLRPGGLLVIENPIPDVERLIHRNGSGLNAEYSIDENKRLVINYHDPETDMDYVSSERLYTKNEYESMFEECGMRLVKAYSEGFVPYSDDKKRMILVAEKL